MKPRQSSSKRSPVNDPKWGDWLDYQGWTIQVLSVGGGQVGYHATKGANSIRSGSQDLATWSGWAKDAKTLALEGVPEECVISDRWSGPCSLTACDKSVQRSAHLAVTGQYCESCCPARKHGGPKKK